MLDMRISIYLGTDTDTVRIVSRVYSSAGGRVKRCSGGVLPCPLV